MGRRYNHPEPEGTIENPQLGDIRQGGEIGYKSKCTYIWNVCGDCGKGRWSQFVKNKVVSPRCLSCACRESKSRGNWKGGRTKDGQSYILVRLETNDFFYPMVRAKPKGHYVSEHRLVMARLLNRCLLPWEVVHHKNGIKDDNRIENLELLPGKKFHLVDTVTQSYIKMLQKENNKLKEEIKRLTKVNF